jgi:hypothetical protein
VATKFVTNLDLNQNQILNGRFEVLSFDPSSGNFEGRMIYRSDLDVVKYHNGTAWKTLINSVASAGANTDAISISNNTDGTVSITLNVADTDSAGLLSATFWNLLNGATAEATGSTLAKRDSSAQIKVATTPTDNNHATSKSYVDGAISSATVSTEAVQDIVGAQIATNGSHTGITATYQDADADGAIDLALDSTYSPTFAGLTINGGAIVFEGATANEFETTLSITDPTADNTITIPNASGTVALTADKLSVFAATSSSELAGVISDETGSGALVFGTSPAITTSLTTASTTFALLNTDATTINFGGAADINLSAAGKTVTIAGNLTVNGTTTTISSTTITVDDKNLELGSVASPDNDTADGGGITLKGATDKTFNWVKATLSWTSSENLNIASGKEYYINGTSVLNSTTLGSGVTGSSLTSVGTITTGTWNGTDIAVADGGTGASTAAGAKTNLGFMTRYATSVGDAVATSYTVTHSLGTRDVTVQVREVASPYAVVIADIAATTTDTVTIDFATAPSENQYRVIVIG